MKHYFSKLFFLFIISLCANCLADCSDHGLRFVPCPKTYVLPDQIEIHEHAIFVQIHDLIIQAESLKTDAQGLFFESAKDDDCGFSQWRCNNRIGRGLACNACNWAWEKTCYACGGKR